MNERILEGLPQNHRDVAQGVTILVVEDEIVSRRALTRLLSASGYVARPVASAEEALRVAQDEPRPLIALVDLDLPGMSGQELVQRLVQLKPTARSVLITAASRERVGDLVAHGVPYLRKPLNFRHLLSILAEKRTCAN
jgi:CheY-like chemotaxis protein